MSTTTLPPGVKATSGGRFDRDDPFLYYIAGAGRLDEMQPPHENVLVAVNELKSPKDFDRFDRLLDERKVLLDSGIFNLAMTHARTHEVSHDVGLSMAPEEIDGFDALWDRYGEVVTKYHDRLWGIVELDQGGVANKPRTRARIEAEFGIVPMPVYHPLLDGWDYYDDIAANYDRMCFGNLVKASPPVRLRLIHTASERARAYPYLWTHLLGIYPNENLLGMPLRGSCDSSSWLTSQRWMPSWKGWSMMKMVTHYPAPMWYESGEKASYKKSSAVNSVTACAVQDTLASMGDDTHGWLTAPGSIPSQPVPPARPHARPHLELVPDLNPDHASGPVPEEAEE